MAKNMLYDDAQQLSVVCTEPATPASGDPVLFGQRPGVALTDERADGTTTVVFEGAYDLEVEALGGAIAAGDIIYYDAAGTPVLNDNSATGVRYGYAGEAVGNGTTDTIMVIIGY